MTTETWTRIEIVPRQFDLTAKGVLAKLWIVEEYHGRTKQMSYHDATLIKYVMVWADPINGKTVPLNWKKVPVNIQNKIIAHCQTKNNPWPGCNWSDDFNKADGDTIYKTRNIPIGD